MYVECHSSVSHMPCLIGRNRVKWGRYGNAFSKKWAGSNSVEAVDTAQICEARDHVRLVT